VTSIRKTAIWAVAGLTGLTLLAGCGDDSKEEAASNGPVNITVAIDAGLQPDAIKAFDTQISQFQAKYPDIKVKREEYTWTAPTFAARLAGGTLPTVFTTAFTDGRSLIARKQVADISSEVDKLPYAKNFSKNVVAAGQDQSGKIEMIPISAYGQGLHYNRELFTKAGLDPDKPPTTWAELRADAKQIADKTGQTGYAVMTRGNTGGWILSTETNAFGGRMTQPDGDKQKATVNNPATTQVLQMIKDMRWQDKSMGANFIYDWNGINQAFAAGKIGMYITGGGTYQNLAAQNNIKPATYGLTTVPLEGADAGVLGGGTLAGVSAKATKAQQAAAVKWIDFYYMNKITTEAGAVLDAKTLAAAKQPVGAPLLPVFDKTLYDQVQTWIKSYVTVPLDQMTNYTNNAFNQPIIPEPPVATQDVYAALDPVVQSVLTNKDANINDLLTKANTKVQSVLDKN
jgi:ABC-type glycerol-3-phosphate transport system substrate-binding protein